MKETLKKYGKRATSFAALAGTLVFPLLVQANAYTTNLDAVTQKAGIGTQTKLTDIIGAGITVILGILGVLLILLIIWAGFQWMTAQGDPGKVDKAKKMIYSAIIGLLVIFAASAITNFVMANLTGIASGNAPSGAQ